MLPRLPILIILTSLVLFSVRMPAQSLTLVGQLNVPGTFKTDVWGYVDPVSGNEYAIVGDQSGSGVTIVDVSNPSSPMQVANVNTVPGFDVKVWDHYIYTVNGGGTGQGSIIDIADPANPVVASSFPSAHNIFIHNGYLYAESTGLKIYSLANITSPQLVFYDQGFAGHDAAVIGDRLFDFYGSQFTRVWNITDPASPQLLSTVSDPTIQYHHSGWTSEDGQFLFICDELANHPTPDITAWNISDPANPTRVGEFSDPTATVHNLYVVGDYAFVSYYTAGLRVFNIAEPNNLQMIDEFDTNTSSGEGFDGAFGVYPFSPNGLIFVSDWDNGLFIFRFGDLTALDPPEDPLAVELFQLFQNYPNPFNPATTIRYNLSEKTDLSLVVYNVLGQPVRTLVSGTQAAGSYTVNWDGINNTGQKPGAGIYLAVLQARQYTRSIKMALIE